MISVNARISIVLCFIILFLPLLIIRIWFDISELQRFRCFTLVLPSAFIFIALYRNRATWLLAFCLFLLGIYYYLFTSNRIAYPGAFEFTLPLNELLYRDRTGLSTGHPIQRFLHLFPFLFYVVALLIFITNPIKKLYRTKSA